MRRPILGILAIILAGTACSDSASNAPAAEALSRLPAEAVDQGVVFIDTAGIRDVLDYDPVDVSQAPTTNPTEMDERDKWGDLVLRMMLPFNPLDLAGEPVIPTTDIDWAVMGGLDTLVQAPSETVEAARSMAPDELGLRFEDGYIIQEKNENGLLTGAELDESLADDESMQALLQCLEGAHMFSAAPPFGENEYHFATAAQVTEDASAQAWACIHVPGRAQEVADSIDPASDSDSVEIGEIAVDGDVVRVEVGFPDDFTMSLLPQEADYSRFAVRIMSPGFNI